MVANAGSMRNQGIEAGITVIPCPNKRFPMDDIHELLDKQKRTFVTFLNDQFVSSGYSDQGSTGEPLTNDNPPHSGRTTDW